MIGIAALTAVATSAAAVRPLPPTSPLLPAWPPPEEPLPGAPTLTVSDAVV